ncbi:hypothetical protein IAG44_00840 [Streptomyces roseirectus]|uniref:Uncharacterized protein n=1 Tax=Streptomyces roseirectus TaxID=2768066 RepID=A0A7H0I5T9_9ACTN|nr:hypothetical protein [Streptomyces roseirectus]QNP68155.1 hypothetical protein IAG44_00840 [Streptomyces roseirectus]
MRKTATAAAVLLATLGLTVPVTAAQAAPAAQARVLADCSPAGVNGRVYAWRDANCSGLLGSTEGNDANWGNSSGAFQGSDDNSATSVANNGYTGGRDVVAFYRLTGGSDAWAGGYLCVGPGVALRDLRGYTFTNGDNANDRISSHEWVTSGGCGGRAFISG